MGGKRVKAGNGLAVIGENEDRGKPALQILARLLLQISIQFRSPTGKDRSIMMRRERFNPVFVNGCLAGHYLPVRVL